MKVIKIIVFLFIFFCIWGLFTPKEKTTSYTPQVVQTTQKAQPVVKPEVKEVKPEKDFKDKRIDVAIRFIADESGIKKTPGKQEFVDNDGVVILKEEPHYDRTDNPTINSVFRNKIYNIFGDIYDGSIYKLIYEPDNHTQINGMDYYIELENIKSKEKFLLINTKIAIFIIYQKGTGKSSTIYENFKQKLKKRLL